MPETYYEILGVPRDASVREIKHAYRLLARRMHPDVCREDGAEDRFKRVNEAYRVLSNHEERGRYDTLGHEQYLRSPPGSRDPAGPDGRPDFRGFSDAFDLFFSEKAWGSAENFRPKPATDILVRVPLTLEEAILGCEKVIEVPYATRCISCGGTGSTTGKARPCPRCGGSGREASPAGIFTGNGSPPCRECGGKGRLPESPCTPCGGWGAVQDTRRVTVRIPAGIDTGMRIRKAGLGREEDGGIPKGDLYIEVTILPHARFSRKGRDLEIPVHISPARAALGCEVPVETLDGTVLRAGIPAGVPNDGVVRIGGEGVKTRDGRGDLVLRIRIDTPEAITSEERSLYRRLLRIEERREEMKGKGLISRYFSRMRGAGDKED